MLQTILVGSKSQLAVVLPVEGWGFSQVDVQRTAIQFARARHHIPDPVALTAHEAAVRMRKQFVAQFAPKMDVRKLNGNSPMCFDNKYEQYQFD